MPNNLYARKARGRSLAQILFQHPLEPYREGLMLSLGGDAIVIGLQ
jgi:hypothetical protein